MDTTEKIKALIKPDADLRGAKLAGVDLFHANLCCANLCCADLRHADLHYADLHDADLHYANLEGADLHYADLSLAGLCRSKLRGADLSGADLTETTDFSGADLTGVNLTGANLTRADLTGANLTGMVLGEFVSDGLTIKWGSFKKWLTERYGINESDISPECLSEHLSDYEQSRLGGESAMWDNFGPDAIEPLFEDEGEFDAWLSDIRAGKNDVYFEVDGIYYMSE